MQGRLDLSSWILHFIHRRNPENDCSCWNEYGDHSYFPFHEDSQTNSRFGYWSQTWANSTLEPDAEAISVLLQILTDGYIRAGWAFRNDKPTIYGPRAACCFTEMPLYALADYAKQRAGENVDVYAIGLPKNEFYTAGGRQVFSGLTAPHKEIYNSRGWPRKLDPSCGLSESEQYRYVAMNLSGWPYIDWSHEREWRWVDSLDTCSCPGLPVWLKDEPCHFSQAIIVVKTEYEANLVLNRITEMATAGFSNYGIEYNRDTLANTQVISIDSLQRAMPQEDLAHVRIDTIPNQLKESFCYPQASPEFVERVRRVLDEAHAAAAQSARDYLATATKNPQGHLLEPCGFAHLILHSVRSELFDALLKLDEAKVFPGIGCWVSNFSKHATQQGMYLEEAAVNGAKVVMEKYFPNEEFSISTRLD